MKLHNDTKVMSQVVRATSGRYNIKLEFIEKDYWITHVLQELSRSKYANDAVFKGGTSLSKAYGLISRFSEDIDLALSHTDQQSGNNIKTIIRGIEKAITTDLTEVDMIGVTSKGSKFRKSVYNYNSSLGKDVVSSTGSIIVETNSFTSPYPFVQLEINNFIAQYLREIDREDLIEDYDLDKFSINVLDARQTLIEKLVSLIRFSHLGKDGLASKIRHFYDIHYLLQDTECKEYITNGNFKSDFESVLAHDKEIFETPKGWQDSKLEDLPLFNNTERVWSELATIYRSELSELAFMPIPAEGDVLASFKLVTLYL